jgi:hypothetical protein
MVGLCMHAQTARRLQVGASRARRAPARAARPLATHSARRRRARCAARRLSRPPGLTAEPNLPYPAGAQFLDGPTLQAVQTLNKVVRTAVAAETHIYTRAAPRFIHGEGSTTLA